MALKNKYGIYIPIDDAQCSAAVHHVLPVSMNGGDEPENLVSLCGECHKAVHRQYNTTGVLWKPKE